ncbi:hypothetical protein CHS0354_030756 [Potamilus streckersoni]|uniref:Sterile alpha motif domain-containing protein 9-like n=1 Tax=Potamilus streckersoni TaxID=2493646 RepID=A0AAE0TDN8_9BIVA|nr:hypothetical protein CHS0354_030756 [Potamilus streckersoni]
MAEKGKAGFDNQPLTPIRMSPSRSIPDKMSVIQMFFSQANISNCQGLQIGNNNEMVVKEAKAFLKHGGNELGLSNNDCVVGMLNSILIPGGTPKKQRTMPLRKLEEEFRKTFGNIGETKKCMSFKDISGMSMKEFLDQNKQHFILFFKRKCEMVQARIIHKKSLSKKDAGCALENQSTSGDSEHNEKNDIDITHLSKDEIEGILPPAENITNLAVTKEECYQNVFDPNGDLDDDLKSEIPSEYFSCDEHEEENGMNIEDLRLRKPHSVGTSFSQFQTSNEDGEWQVVKKSKKRNGQRNGQKDSRQKYQVTTGRKAKYFYVAKHKNIMMTEEKLIKDHQAKEKQKLLETLINQQESRDLIFYPSDSFYSKNHLRFMLDLVSMWNTPHREKSHIVLGVEVKSPLPHDLPGIKASCTDDYYHKIFLTTFFTMQPQFTYFEVYFNDKLFGIIEILSSCNHGQPSIVCIGQDLEDISVEKGQLWFRPHNHREVCDPTSLVFGDIYRWFLNPRSPPLADRQLEVVEKKDNSPKVGGSSPKLSLGSNKTSEFEQIKFSCVSPGTTVNEFLSVVDNFKKPHYVLISGGVSSTIKHLEGLSHVPWIAVYDFDIYSRDSGLLNANEDFIERKRSLRITTWDQNPPGMSERGTLWCFMRGARHICNSRTDNTDGERIETVREWLKKVRNGLECHCDQLARFADDYAILTLVVLWPQNDHIAPFIHKFIERIDEKLNASPKIVICLSHELSGDHAQSSLKLLTSENEENVHIIKLDTETLCLGILNHLKNQHQHEIKYELPTADGSPDPGLTDKDAVWLRDDLDVLFLSSPYTRDATDVEALSEEEEQFFKGGTLHWFAWYGLNQLDIERDLLEPICRSINESVRSQKSTVVKLLHAPGSGGTTLAQRVLWKFHTQIPCLQIKLQTVSAEGDLVAKIGCLHKKTHLPILIMIDGEEEGKVHHLVKCLRSLHVIILYVRRFPHRIKESQDAKTDTFWLKNSVSPNEAGRLAMKFGERCGKDYQKKEALKQLSQDVQSGKRMHSLYEFGMTVYQNKFRGIQAYVRGYLQLDQNQSRELYDWQKVLGYLSLAYFYGQIGLPCQFFTELLHKASNYDVSLEDFPHPVGAFIVSEDEKERKKHIRICHYLVAKEILEQLLSRQDVDKHISSDNELADKARKNLEKFCCEFIDYISKRKSKSNFFPDSTSYILTRIFIFRESSCMGETEDQNRKKPALSKVMTDIVSYSPMYTERLNVLKKLTTAFPNDPNFQAHLGRFYAYCRPDEDEIAEKCFKKALSLCQERTKGKPVHELNDRIRLTLMHIYHMYGTIYQKRISRHIERHKSETTEVDQTITHFDAKLKELVSLSELACSHFRKTREYTPPGHETSYAYTGELRVHLQLCDFVHKHFNSNIQNFLDSTADISDKEFIQGSISRVDYLVMECYQYLDYDDIDPSLPSLISWYNSLFRHEAMSLHISSSQDDVCSRRFKITAKKLKHVKNDNSNVVVENIRSKEDINEIIRLYEENFEDIFLSGCENTYVKRNLEIDFLEWLKAIRHDLADATYEVEDVLAKVYRWNDLLHSPLSEFYIFVLKSLLGFGSEKKRGNTECLLEAINELKAKVTSLNRLVVRPRHPREWLGTSSEGICQLIYGGPYDDREINPNLKICKGTICPPNKKTPTGWLDLDLGNNVPVKVFYIPGVAKLEGSRFVGRRVEFVLGFSIENGYEAFKVSLLKQYGCSSCSSKVEITQMHESAKCVCGTVVYKSDFTTV